MPTSILPALSVNVQQSTILAAPRDTASTPVACIQLSTYTSTVEVDVAWVKKEVNKINVLYA